MRLIIQNDAEISAFLRQQMQSGNGAVAVKGQAPEGATWEDGTPITRPVNVAWECPMTGKRVNIRYGEA